MLLCFLAWILLVPSDIIFCLKSRSSDRYNFYPKKAQAIAIDLRMDTRPLASGLTSLTVWLRQPCRNLLRNLLFTEQVLL